ncbi:heterokaryon incompatibility protein-domain-containing protein [Exophiala viscosa]|uniref:heterokaryon incompatibility protein-domain-containing protein n=1 Tax=Exophiala viscosa TaxID=2486360 RepID=UPI00219E20AD|nr:heterokaryon incompatibility protein-domain-containing protein [Exophiala viscosa]
MPPAYRYEPLSSTSSEIRLLTLWPGSWDDDISCTVDHACVDNHPYYEALSYTWGDANDTRPIRLNGGPFQIAKNLEIALHYFRPQPGEQPRLLWVDAICINQKDLGERGQQVQKMRQIFTSARRVLAWTGEADEDSAGVLDLIDDIAKISPRHLMAAARAWSTEPIPLRDGGVLDLSKRDWTSLLNFLDRPYWHRVWIVQELTSATPLGPLDAGKDTLAIFCGFRSFSRYAFEMVCDFWGWAFTGRFAGFKTDDFQRGARALYIYLSTSEASRLGKDPSLIELVRSVGLLEASDPRDRVYAVLGLTDLDKTLIAPDYTKTVEQVYIDLVKCCIVAYGNCNILSGNQTRRLHGGPSWCCIDEFMGSDLIDFEAAGKTSACIDFDDQNGSMTATGLHVGAIRTVVGPMFPDQTFPEAFVDIEAWKQIPEMIALQKIAHSLGEAQQETLCRCILMNAGMTTEQSVYSDTEEAHRFFRSVLGLPSLPDRGQQDPLSAVQAHYRVMIHLLKLSDRHFFMTQCGKMGIGPYDMQTGDSVVVLYGGDSCFVLRSVGTQYTLQGDAYVQGIMHGELLEDIGEDGNPKNTRKFVIC